VREGEEEEEDPKQRKQQHHTKKPLTPLPRGPPAKRENTGSIFASAPPSFAKTIPVLTVTTRVFPSAAAFAASASHSTQSLARKSLPEGEDSEKDAVSEVP